MPRYDAEVAAAFDITDALMFAFNEGDLDLFNSTFNFPAVRVLANGVMKIDQAEDHPPAMFDRSGLPDWDHSAWERREVVHAGPDKVHLATRFSRYRSDGSAIDGYESLYVITRQNGRWGVKMRSSFAP